MSVKQLMILGVAGTLAVVIIGCGGSGGGGDAANHSNRSEYTTDCGVIDSGRLVNPVKASDGELVAIQVVGGNKVIASNDQGQRLIQLAGIGSVAGFRNEAAIALMNSLAGQETYLYETNPGCQVDQPGGAIGSLGSLVTASGVSYAEELLRAGYVSASTHPCGDAELTGCYQALADTAVPVGGNISNFLWKPAGEHDGNLVILFNPGPATVLVNGEALRFTGASNGRGTTARGNRNGCAYGANARVEAFDQQGRVLLFPGGAREWIIADGCQRVEF